MPVPGRDGWACRSRFRRRCQPEVIGARSTDGCGGQVTGVSTRRGQLVELARVITASPALLTREQQIFAPLTDSLAQLIAEDTGEASGAVEPRVAANAHMGVHRGLVAHVRRLILVGARDDALAAAIRAEADRALGLVEHGPTAPSACSAPAADSRAAWLGGQDLSRAAFAFSIEGSGHVRDRLGDRFSRTTIRRPCSEGARRSSAHFAINLHRGTRTPELLVMPGVHEVVLAHDRSDRLAWRRRHSMQQTIANARPRHAVGFAGAFRRSELVAVATGRPYATEFQPQPTTSGPSYFAPGDSTPGPGRQPACLTRDERAMYDRSWYCILQM